MHYHTHILGGSNVSSIETTASPAFGKMALANGGKLLPKSEQKHGNNLINEPT
jgi:hypothetical protein